jgi:PAS domain S-box-containing protein
MTRHREKRQSIDSSKLESIFPACADDILMCLNTTNRKVKESEDQIRIVVENIKEVVFVTDAAGLWKYLNKSWTEVTGYSVNESLGNLFLNYVHPDDRERNTELFTPLIERKKDYCRHEVRYLTKDGGYRWVEVYARLGINEKDEVTGTYGTLLDITDRKRSHEFENVIMQLSSKLTGIPLSEFSTSIHLALSQIGEFLDADRSYIFEMDPTGMMMSNTFEWCNTDITPCIDDLQDIPCEVLPRWMECLQNNENIIIPCVAELPESWQAEKEILEPQSIQSLLVIPLFADNLLIGFVGLDSVRQQKAYTTEELNTLKVWGSMLAGLIKQKRSKILLEQERSNFESFFNTIDEFLWVLDEQGNIIYANQTVYKRLGYTIEELNNQSVLMVHPEERREEAGRIVGEMLAGLSEFCPVPLVTKSGEYIPVETRVKSGFWNGQSVIYGTSKDMSKIKFSEEKFSKAFQSNSSLMAISTFDDGIYIDVNDTFLKTLEYQRGEIIGQNSIKMGFFPSEEVRLKLVEQIREHGSVRDYEMDMQTKSGKKLVGLFSADPIYIGKDRCLLTVMLNITDRKKNEEAIQKATKEASKANQAKSEFLSRMSHELRTPLNSILGFGQLLEMGDLKDSQRKGVEHILKSGNYLLNLINEVLDITKIESGKLELSMEPVQVWGVVREMIESVEQQAQKRNIRLILDHLDKDVYFKADKQRLKQVILNLLNNAVKYNIDDGYIDVRIERTRKDEFGNQLICLQISDNGIGISPENVSNLFNPFERAGAQNSKTEGTGLGLAVVKKLVEAMGGTVGVESKLGEGSCFWVELPEETRINLEESRIISEMEFETDENVHGTVLYVEDNLPNIELVEMILSSQRPEIRLNTVMNGKTAVNLAARYEADLILLDLNLPGMMGEEVLSRLKADVQTRDIPVVVVSADAMPQRIENILSAGAEEFLTKPLNMKDFLCVIDKYTLKTL